MKPLWGLGALLLVLAACTVKPAESQPRDASSNNPQSNPQCAGGKSSQDACVERCKAAAPDQASRGPCFNDCMRQSPCG